MEMVADTHMQDAPDYLLLIHIDDVECMDRHWKSIFEPNSVLSY